MIFPPSCLKTSTFRQRLQFSGNPEKNSEFAKRFVAQVEEISLGIEKLFKTTISNKMTNEERRQHETCDLYNLCKSTIYTKMYYLLDISVYRT